MANPANDFLNRIASNSGWSIFSELSGKIIFVIANIYLARVLGVENFGLFTLAQIVTSYFWLGVDLGTNMYGVREIAKNPSEAEEIINSLLTLRIIAGFFVFAIYILSLTLFFDLSTLQKNTFIACGLYLIIFSFYSDWVFKGFEKFKFVAIGKIISSLCFFSGIFIFINSKDDIFLAAMIWSLSFFLGAIVLLVLMYVKLNIKLKPSLNISGWLFHLKKSIFFTLGGALNIGARTLPIFLIGIFHSPHEVGLFSAPYRIVNSICSLGAVFSMGFYPILSNSYSTDKKGFTTTRKFLFTTMLITGLLFCSGGLLYPSYIIKGLFGKEYIHSIGLLKILIWVVLIIFIRLSFGIPILAMGAQRLRAIVGGIGFLISLILGLAFVPLFGIKGAAASLLISELFIMLALAAFYFKKVISEIKTASQLRLKK